MINAKLIFKKCNRALIKVKNFFKKLFSNIKAMPKNIKEHLNKKKKNKEKEETLVTVKRSMPIRNLIMLSVLLISVMVTVLSWFMTTGESKINGVNISVRTTGHLEISLDKGENKEYHKYIDIGEHINLEKDIKMLDITGDGNTFLRPELEQANGIAVVKPSGEWETPTEGVDYISFDLFLRSNTPLDVYLGSDSATVPSVGFSNLTWYDAENKHEEAEKYNGSTYGDFSKDCIIGAARLAFLNEYNSNTNQYDNTKFIWIPNPNIYLDSNNWVVNTNIANNAYGTFTHSYYKPDKTKVEYPNEKTVTDLTATEDIIPEDTKSMITTTNIPASEVPGAEEGYYYSRVKVNTWIEGTDTEARRALAGGYFNMELDLIGYIKET